MKRKSLCFFLCAIFCFTTTFAQQQNKIEFKAPLVYPEGIAYNPKTNMFYVSSVTTGTIGSVDHSGNYQVFYKDSTLKSSFGMKVDAKRNRLLVCTGDPNYSKYSDSSTFKKISKVIALDLSSGKKMAEIDLAVLQAGKHFANDMTLDEQGNIYVTDSYSPVIYKIDAHDKGSVFVTHDLFQGKDVGLNGIAYHPKGFLLAVNNSAGTILKIDAKNPTKVSKIKIDQFFPADGLLLDKENNLSSFKTKA